MGHVLRFCFIHLLNDEEGGFCYMDRIIFSDFSEYRTSAISLIHLKMCKQSVHPMQYKSE